MTRAVPLAATVSTLASSARIDDASIGAAADVAFAGARGFGHNDFKVPLVRRTLRAVLVGA